MAHETRLGKALRVISIRSRRSRAYFEAALALTTVIPMLSLCVIMLSLFTDLLPDSTLLRAGLAGAGGIACAAGYLMLHAYPANLGRVRDYLSRIASEDLPDRAELLPVEQDFSDIEFYMNEVIGGLEKHIARLDEELARSRQMLETIGKQSAEIVAAERQRVMLESLGAACHHISQPMTVLSLYLNRMRDSHDGDEEGRELKACLDAVESISVILLKLKHVSEYRTVPYTTFLDGTEGEGSTHMKILDIEQERAVTVVSG